ncbi:integrating conjugative element protein, PFL_4693 family [Serratia fonticola]|uniref:Integrating conjugative element protein, PFL_4693 family n=1 Tax=Serratia fonticola TaxID=47917 RepID=A0A4U9UW19_SERFO|nr:integrating conjugative element protein, PFL_4693 family [Serratia fonticola]
MKLTSIALVLGLGMTPLFPATAALQTEQSQLGNTASVSTTLQALEEEQSKKSAQEWGLTTEEWQRYQQLSKGRRGILSPGLDPITTLGIEARTEEERRHYADLSVKQDFQRVEAELAFQREVNAAWVRVYPGIPTGAICWGCQAGQRRLALFVRSDCGVPCETKSLRCWRPNARWISIWWGVVGKTSSAGLGAKTGYPS